MTTALIGMASDPDQRVAPPLAVTAVLLATAVDDGLVDALVALAESDRCPDALLVVDATPAGDLRDRLADSPFAADLPPTDVVRMPPGTSLHAALRGANAHASAADSYWVLSQRTVPEPAALGQLAGVMQGSASAGVVAPKLMDAARPGRLLRFGIQVTRSGRLQADPRPGQPDQQQYDDRRDAIAAPLEGTLVRRTAYADLGGHDEWLGRLGTDLDFGWRAQLAGHRVVLAPRARVGFAGRVAQPPTATQRRDARRVALARRPLALAPLLAAWIAVSSLGLALGLVLLKRPAAAARQLAELGAPADRGRPAGARLRGRGPRRVAGRDLRGLFITRDETTNRAADRLHDVVVPRRPHEPGGDPPPSIAEGAGPGTAAAPLWTSPAIWGPALAAAASALAFRALPGGPGQALGGLMGGELTYLRADGAGLWRSWWDAWAGPGLGSSAAAAPGSAVMALLTWLYQALPGDAGPSPAARVLGTLILLAPALAFLSAYTGGRVLTHRRLPRAACAGLWALSPAGVAAVREGRLGALALLVGLPLLGAGFVQMARRTTRPGVVAATALITAALSTVVPGVLVLGALVAVGLLLAGSAQARVRGLVYLALTAVAAAPVLLVLAERPSALLAGWGLLAESGAPPPWQLALAIPDTAVLETAVAGIDGTVLAALGVPAVLVGLVGLVVPRGGVLPALAGLVSLAGLAMSLGAPHVELAEAPGSHPWPGAGQLLMTLGLLGAGLIAAGRGRSPAWPAVVTGVAGLGAACLAVAFALPGIGAALIPAVEPLPAVAVDQARSPLATRTLLLRGGGGETIDYDLIGREPGLPARDLGPAPARRLDPVITELVDPSDPSTDAADALAGWGVGFVLAEGEVGSLTRRLDATAGLTRISDHNGRAVWRVSPAGAPVTLSRALLVDEGQVVSGDVGGAHAAGSTALTAGDEQTLLVAESPGWAAHATVRADGTEVRGRPSPSGRVAYALPAGTAEVEVTVDSRFGAWGVGYLVLLVVIAYLAVPLGAAPRAPDTGRRAGAGASS